MSADPRGILFLEERKRKSLTKKFSRANASQFQKASQVSRVMDQLKGHKHFAKDLLWACDVQVHIFTRNRCKIPKRSLYGPLVKSLVKEQRMWLERLAHFVVEDANLPIHIDLASLFQQIMTSDVANAFLGFLVATPLSRATLQKGLYALAGIVPKLCGKRLTRIPVDLRVHARESEDVFRDLAGTLNSQSLNDNNRSEQKRLDFDEPAEAILHKLYFLLMVLRRAFVDQELTLDEQVGFVVFAFFLARPTTRSEIITKVLLAHLADFNAAEPWTFIIGTHKTSATYGCLLCVFPVWFSQILQTYLKSTRRTIMKQKVWGHGNSSKLFPQDCVSAMGRLFKHRMPSVLVNPSSIRRLVSICFGLLPRHSTWFSFRDDMVVTCAHALSRGSTLELHYERNKRPREDVLQMFLRSQFYVPALNRYEECLYGHGKVDAKHSVSLEPRTDLELTALRQAINSTRGPVQPTSEIFNDQDSKNATLESAREAVADESMDFGTSDSEPEYDTETPSFVFEEEGFFAVAASSEEGNVVACVEEVDLCQTGQEAQASNTGSQTTINQALCQAENFWRCVPPNISRAGFKSCQSCADFHSSFRKLNSRERAKTKEKYLSNTKKKLKTE